MAADEDIKSQLKEVEAILEDGDKRIRQMVEVIPNALVYFLDTSGSLLYMNKALETAVGDNLTERTYAKLVKAEEGRVAKMLADVKSVIETSQPIVVEKERFELHNGYTRTVRTQIAPLEYNGQPACMVLSLVIDHGADDVGNASRKHAADSDEKGTGTAKKAKNVGGSGEEDEEEEGDGEHNQEESEEQPDKGDA